ncbi:putative Nuclear pore membrane glycoprotein 210-like 4, partial [Homarus americanus]
TTASICTVDTDVVVLAVTLANRLNIDAHWVSFKAGKNMRYDSVSFSAGKGKKTAWEVWMSYYAVTATFGALGATPKHKEYRQHTMRAVYQAGYCWAQAMIAESEFPSPDKWGWVKNDEDEWDVCWTTLPEASADCRELLRCGCKRGAEDTA